jgi:ankyrin repeat protein
MSLADLLDDALDDESDEDEDGDYVGGEEDEEDGEEDDMSPSPGASFDMPAWQVTRLHPLVSRGETMMLERVIASGAGLEGSAAERFVERLNRPDSAGATPLHHAIISAAIETTVAAAGPNNPWAPDSARRIQLLLGEDDSRDTDSADADAELAAAIAADDAAADVRAGANATANADGYVRCIQLLLSAGARHEQRFFGRTTLHLAAVVGCLPAAARFAASAAQALLDANADLSVVDSDGQTPLHLAAVAGSADAASVLGIMLRHLDTLHPPGAGQAIVLQADRAGRSALHAALRAGGPPATAVALALLGAGADANSPDHDGTTPLHLAAAGCTADLVAELIRAGAFVTATDGYFRTPAQVAAACGRCDLVGSILGLSAEACGAAGGRPQRTHLYAHPACLLHVAPVGAQVDNLGAAEKCAAPI